MKSSSDADHESKPDDLSELANTKQESLLTEFIAFALENKKWWLIPIVLVLSLVALLIFISGTAGPFIYPLF